MTTIIRSKLNFLRPAEVVDLTQTDSEDIQETMVRIGMVDADLIDGGTRHPNLAQMKISAYCKRMGCNVTLLFREDELNNLDQYDAVIVSKVFNFSKVPESIEKIIGTDYRQYNADIVFIVDQCRQKHNGPLVAIGGTGFFEDGGRDLNEIIEHIMPDYTLYDEFVNSMIESGKKRSNYSDYLDYSIGFTSRGCFRQCKFCVNKKYRRSIKHSPVSEFFDPSRKRIYLWDDNMFACKDWELIMDELEATKRPFQFRQGLDLRILTDKKAERLSKAKYYGDMIFAFDHVDDYELITKKLELWSKYYKRETKVYLICAFDPVTYTDPSKLDEKDGPYLRQMASLKTHKEREQLDIEFLFERIRVCMQYDCLPYVMRYEAYKQSEYRGVYIQIARWCNQPRIFKKMSFREFCEANQALAKDGRICSTMKAYDKIVSERPDIAERYFGMKYRLKDTIPGRRYVE